MRNKCADEDVYECPHLDDHPAHAFGGTVAIANRGAGSFSLVDPVTLETVVETMLPDSGEPMYFAYTRQEIWVGDRKNNKLHIYFMTGCQLKYDGYVEAPADGVFHTMTTQRSGPYPIAVTTIDIDNVIVAHDLTTRRLLGTMEPPPEAVAAGAVKPHDVTTNGDYIFVTFLGPDETPADFVASYDAVDFSLVSVIETEKDPHVAVRDDSHLFIAAQGGIVYTVTVPDLNVVNHVELPAPHGMFLSFDLKHLYVTNISGGGVNAIQVFDAKTGDKRNCPEVTTTYPKPHNPTLSADNSKLFVTHSGGTSTKNSAFDIMHDGCVDPHSERIFDTNSNPFGLCVVPEAVNLLVCTNDR